MIRKKYIKKLLIVVCMFYLLMPVFSKAAIKSGDTLRTLREQLKELQAKEAAQKNKKAQTQGQINANKNNKRIAETEMEKAKQQVEDVKLDIERTNVEIEKAKEESEELLFLYQKSLSENVYASYISGASTMTDLIMRADAINQISEENNNKLNELESLIKNNEKLEKELAKFQVKLDNKILAYDASIEELNGELDELEEGALSIADDIAVQKTLIKTYEAMGCKEDQDLQLCASIAHNSGWLKPISKGRVTSLYGPRTSPTAGASSYHRGIDIGVAEGTKVYATAAGTVGAIINRSSCGGNMVYIWAYVNGKPYTYVFMHMLEIHVKVGQAVSVDTVVGLSGGGSTATRNGGYDRCTTGAHLHYGLASGGFYGKDKPLSKFNANTMNPPGYPGYYQWFYTR